MLFPFSHTLENMFKPLSKWTVGVDPACLIAEPFSLRDKVMLKNHLFPSLILLNMSNSSKCTEASKLHLCKLSLLNLLHYENGFFSSWNTFYETH